MPPGPFPMFETLAEEEANSALIRELCTGRRLLDEMSHFREHKAAQEAHALRESKSVGVLGKQVLNIPQREYFRIVDRYGVECFSDKQFIRDFQRLEPDLAVHKA